MGFMASEEMLFENVDRRTTRMPGYTIRSPMSFRLKSAKKLQTKELELVKVLPRTVANTATETLQGK